MAARIFMFVHIASMLALSITTGSILIFKDPVINLFKKFINKTKLKKKNETVQHSN